MKATYIATGDNINGQDVVVIEGAGIASYTNPTIDAIEQPAQLLQPEKANYGYKEQTLF